MTVHRQEGASLRQWTVILCFQMKMKMKFLVRDAALPDEFLGWIRHEGVLGLPPGNSYSRAEGAPYDSRRSACLHPPLAAAGSSPPKPAWDIIPNPLLRFAAVEKMLWGKLRQGSLRFLTTF